MLVEIEDSVKALNSVLEILEKAFAAKLSLPFMYSIS
jgi:hypothetical protein